VRPSRYDAGIPLQERWLFPSRKSAVGKVQRSLGKN
jgi:hypothetical protein